MSPGYAIPHAGSHPNIPVRVGAREDPTAVVEDVPESGGYRPRSSKWKPYLHTQRVGIPPDVTSGCVVDVNVI